jgi:hypothetical protein
MGGLEFRPSHHGKPQRLPPPKRSPLTVPALSPWQGGDEKEGTGGELFDDDTPQVFSALPHAAPTRKQSSSSCSSLAGAPRLTDRQGSDRRVSGAAVTVGASSRRATSTTNAMPVPGALEEEMAKVRAELVVVSSQKLQRAGTSPANRGSISQTAATGRLSQTAGTIEEGMARVLSGVGTGTNRGSISQVER